MPAVHFRHIDDFDWKEVIVQMHGDKRVTTQLKFLEMSPTRTVIYTHYDAGMTLEEHGHSSDHVLFILKGMVTIGDQECPPGMMVLLEHGATFGGTIVAGPEGCELIEFYTGDITPVPKDREAFHAMLDERGIKQVPVNF